VIYEGSLRDTTLVELVPWAILAKRGTNAKWWAVQDSDLRPLDQESTALPAELTAQVRSSVARAHHPAGHLSVNFKTSKAVSRFNV
jgi:hypothetical protein